MTRRARTAAAAALLAAVLCATGGTVGTVGAQDAQDADDAQDAPPAAPAAKDLVARLGDPAAHAAAEAELVKLGAAAVPDLVAALADAQLRVPALGVIEKIGPAAKEAAGPVGMLLSGAPSAGRAAAVRAVGALGADALKLTSPLAVLVGNPRAPERADAARAVGRILSDHAARAPRPATTTPLDRAIADGCSWLVRHQSEDGRWAAKDFSLRCAGARQCGPAGDEENDAGVTGLALLALLGADAPGIPADPARARAVDAGIAWLLSVQRADGVISPDPNAMKWCYVHGCAAYALAEAYRRTGRADLRAPVERAMEFTLSKQSPKPGGWRYGDGDADTSVTAWMAMGLAAAADAGIHVSLPGAEGLPGALRWVESVTDPANGSTGYQQRGGASARTLATQARFPAAESAALVACGVTVRLLAGQDADDPIVLKSLSILRARPPRWDVAGGRIDLYYWMHASECLRQIGGPDYAAWRTSLIAALLPRQHPAKAGCAAGSWPEVDPWTEDGAGRVYATAMAVLALDACERDPATLPVVPAAQRSVVAVLEKAAADADAAVSAAARRSLGQIRRAFR